jgi:TonB-linked SusC/RagA family outer membrane protein
MKKSILIILLLIAATTQAFSQKTVQGFVTDNNGLPLIGVTVVVKGASKGTVTDLDGKYSIPGLKSADVLVFRYVGFETQELKIGTQQKINVSMDASSVQLEEMVVVGYGTSRKIDLTGSVASIDVQDLSKTGTSNFDQALAGRVTGVEVVSTDGTPGEALNIVIRGGNSITGSNNPLYVVDGIPLETFDPASISTRDIKSFDILKDASATAIYGARGANGVILISTNSGRDDGKTDILLHVRTAFQYIPNRMEVLSPYEYVKMLQVGALANDNNVPGTSTSQFNRSWVDPELYRNVKGTSWQDEIFQTAIVQDYNFAISGGTKKNSVYYSGSYVNQPGTLINTSFKKLNNRLKFTNIISDALTLNSQITYNYSLRGGLQVSGDAYNSIIRDAVRFRPVVPITSLLNLVDDSAEEDVTSLLVNTYSYNPVSTLMNSQSIRISDDMSGNMQLQYKFLKNFTFNASGNYTRTLQEASVFYGADTQQGTMSSDHISGRLTNTTTQILTMSNTLRYNEKIGKSRYEALAGTEWQNRVNKSSALKNTNLPTDAFGMDNLGLATGSTIATTGKSANSLLSYFGRLNYNYGDRYLATLNLRADGSTKFQKQNRWGYFPSFSTAWRVSEEPFIKNIDDISNLKLRLGYGVTGNNRIGDFEAYNLMSVRSSSGYVLGVGEVYSPGAFQSNMAMPDLRWEVTSQYNAGVDFGFFKNRISATVDYYLKRTKDLLLDAQMSPSTGFLTTQQNVGEVQNEGLEIEINTLNFKSKKFTWTSNFNISFNRNKTIKLNSGQSEIIIDPQWNNGYCQTEYQYITKVGQPVGMIYGLEYDGLYQLDDFNWTNGGTYSVKPGHGVANSPGRAKFKDQLTVDTNNDGIADAGDGVINQYDRVVIGNPHPKHSGGFSNHLKYKNLELQVLLQWRYGFDILNANKAEFENYATNRNSLPGVADMWTTLNTNSDVSGVRYNGSLLSPVFGNKVDSRYIDDGSYLKLKTVVLGYNLPKKMLSKLHIKNCKFSLSAQNLFALTKYSGYDPDVTVGRYGALTPGLDYSSYPQSTTISGGIDITF